LEEEVKRLQAALESRDKVLAELRPDRLDTGNAALLVEAKLASSERKRESLEKELEDAKQQGFRAEDSEPTTSARNKLRNFFKQRSPPETAECWRRHYQECPSREAGEEGTPPTRHARSGQQS
jgi:hypothetical protein